MGTIRVGIIGLGANTRLKHVPGLRACQDVEITAVCNSRPQSTQAAAAEFGIPKKFADWQELVQSPDVDAVVIGAWPNLHCPATLAALDAGKHVLTEARMAMSADEARQMYAASLQHPELVTQIVPSPFGLRGGQVVREMIEDGYLGELREVVVLGTSNETADPQRPLHWRQRQSISGVNMLLLGILHETLIRWTPSPQSVQASTQVFTTERVDASTGMREPVTRPESVQVLTKLPGGVQGLYHLSSAIHFGPPPEIRLFGSEGSIFYQLLPEDRLLAGKAGDEQMQPVEIPAGKAGGWRVEEEFINAIRGEEEIKFTTFETGVRYMEFTQAVEDSAQSGATVDLPEEE